MDNSIIVIKNSVENQMVEIPAGEIELHDNRLKQKWKVLIPSFYLSKHLVTQKLYEELINESPSHFKGAHNPVESISWIEAVNFCNLLSSKTKLLPCYQIDDVNEQVVFDAAANGYRLPTEAEWEYACKAGTTDVRYNKINDICWYKENSEAKTHYVGAKEPNAWGLFDMLGNVWEWCTDVYDETVYGSYRIIRGGGWSDEARGCMATNRRRSHPTAFKIDDLGFRIARNLEY